MEEKENQGTGLEAKSEVKDNCAQAGTASFIMGMTAGPIPRAPDGDVRYSPGDRVNIKIFDSDEFSGDYVVSADGVLHFPLIGEVRAAGLTNRRLHAQLTNDLVRAKVFRRDQLRLSVRPVQYAPINVRVSGAVFRPGQILINQIPAADKTEAALRRFGDNPLERTVSAALRNSGGVRPDADLSAVELVRGGKRFRLDFRGVFTGTSVDEVTLIVGDYINVPSGPCFQSGLVRPSQITPDSIRVFASAVSTQGAASASGLSMPYGIRFLQALAAANCVGGALTINAHRSAVLVSKNLRTGVTEVVQRSVEELVRSQDRDAINPFLMPDDAIACYDSEMINIRELLSMVSVSTATMLNGVSIRR